MLVAIDLLPCPYCGGEARYVYLHKSEDGSTENWVLRRFNKGEVISNNYEICDHIIRCKTCGATAQIPFWNKREFNDVLMLSPKSIIFCHKNQKEQDMNLCCNCENFKGIDIENDLFYIKCVK